MADKKERVYVFIDKDDMDTIRKDGERRGLSVSAIIREYVKLGINDWLNRVERGGQQ